MLAEDCGAVAGEVDQASLTGDDSADPVPDLLGLNNVPFKEARLRDPPHPELDGIDADERRRQLGIQIPRHRTGLSA